MSDIILTDDHKYVVAGRELPGVTTVLSAVGIIDYSMIPERIREQALERGSYVHEATAMDDRGELDYDSLDPRLVPYLDAYRAFRDESGFVPEIIEEPVASESMGYAGTPDRLGKLGRQKIILDIKTGSVPDWAGLQLAAYKQLCGGAPHRYVVCLTAEGRYSLSTPYTDTSDIRVFMGALSVYNWQKEHNKKGADNE